ncbi:MAG: hypothetical protein QG623_434 [Patescibacteria group bacterium]|nr:hypothetical protein [Patescibacteria group bacterium]
MIKFKKLDNNGAVSPLLLGLVAVSLMLIGALVFGLGKMSEANDYKNNFDQKVGAEVQEQSQLIAEQKQAEFDEKEKAPFSFWTSPTQYGSIKVGFPKTWSYYLDLDQEASGSNPINLYAHPDYVPAVSNTQKYALRLTLTADDYNKILDGYRRKSDKEGLKIGTIQVSNVSGIKVKGLLTKDISGTLVVFPIRDKVLTVWTESNDFEPDFENIILKNLSFIP